MRASIGTRSSKITPMVHEANSGCCQPSHLCDDYQLSQNLARFGLHTETIMDLGPKLGIHFSSFYHIYAVSNEEKVKHLQGVLDFWRTQKFVLDEKHNVTIPGL